MPETKTHEKSCQHQCEEEKHDGVTFTPRFDIWETDEELVLFGDLPGVTPQELDVRFEDGQLILHGRVAVRQLGGQPLHREYGVGDFHRTFAIDETIDSSRISAELKAGVLALHLPKSEAVKPKRIPVTSG
jgi:HSP20 family molecular chaperone IbpA